MSKYPKVKDQELVGTYSVLAKSGGGYVWDNVLEYRVWCYPSDGAADIEKSDFSFLLNLSFLLISKIAQMAIVQINVIGININEYMEKLKLI